MKRIILLSVFAILLSSGSLFAQEKQVVKTVDKTTCLKEMQKDSFIIIDVRTPEEFNKGHLEKAVNYNFYERDFEDKLKQIDTNKKVIIYCEVGGRSAVALKKMKEMGFKYVLEIEGGYRSWKKT